MRRPLLSVLLPLLLSGAVCAQSTALSVNPESREEVRQFYRAVYFASEQVPMEWTGNYAAGAAGTVANAFRDATRLRINFFRALAGVPADVTFNPSFSARAQQAAMLMSVNNDLSHTPPSSWTLFSAAGAEGAANSNLALGQAGPDAITGYIADHGDRNGVVGHRRWLLYPQTLQMGSGDVPGLPGSSTVRAANAVWVIDTTPGGQFGAPRPVTRTTAVPYPPAGYVPSPLVWPRWSFSHPGADFSNASVTMTRDGQSVPVALETYAANFGEPTLVWVYDNLDSSAATSHPRPTNDVVYVVTVANVRLGGETKAFTYRVTVFDPETPGADFVPVGVQGPVAPTLSAASTYSVNKPGFASGFDWRTLQLTTARSPFSAETGLEGLLAGTTPGYEVVQSIASASGRQSYRLAHLEPRSDQILLLPETYRPGPDAQLVFRSRLAIATATETARVQISTDDGTSWSDLYTQTGTSPTTTGFPPPTESAFIERRLALANYAGRTVRLRFVYSIGFGGAFIPDATNQVGWFIDDLSLLGVEAVIAEAPSRVASGSNFLFAPAAAGSIGVQARGVLFGAYPMEWGPVTSLEVVEGSAGTATSYLSNLSVRTAAGTGPQTLIVGFSVNGGTKPLLVRGIGPSLTSFGVSGALADPTLALYRGTSQISLNDNWLPTDASTFTGVGAFGLANGSKDAALVVSVGPSSYTAQVSGANGTTGIALVELYDASVGATPARLANVSARSQVGVGNDILIAGFSVAGSGPRKLLLRAVGPTLGAFGVDGALDDPKLELFGPAGRIMQNDNWNVADRAAFAGVGAFDLETGSRDAVIVVTLPPGNYTAQVSGTGGATGVALVEIYDLP